VIEVNFERLIGHNANVFRQSKAKPTRPQTVSSGGGFENTKASPGACKEGNASQPLFKHTSALGKPMAQVRHNPKFTSRLSFILAHEHCVRTLAPEPMS
jgi:hypothetical protein